MLLKLNNIVPQKCSVHKIITGFIKNINSECTTGDVVQSQRGWCQPPVPSCHVPPGLGILGRAGRGGSSMQLAAGKCRSYSPNFSPDSQATTQAFLKAIAQVSHIP